MAPYPKFTTFPPLGQHSIIPPEQEHISFTVIIEWNLVRPPYPYEVSLAFTGAGSGKHESQWARSSLQKISGTSLHVLDGEDCQRAVYVGQLSRHDLLARASDSAVPTHFLFTVTFRVDTKAPWNWVSVLDGTTPGELILQANPAFSLKVESVLSCLDLAEGWSTTPVQGGTSTSPTQTFVLEYTHPIRIPEPGVAFTMLPLARIPLSARYFSIVKPDPFWLVPRQGKGSFFHVEEDALVSSFLLSNGLILTFVVLGWIDDVHHVIRSDDQGRIVIARRNDDETGRHYQEVVMSAGFNLEETMSAAMDQVRNIVESSVKIGNLKESIQKIAPVPEANSVITSNEQWVDSLAFCTWNALGQDLTETKLLNALDQLKKNDVHISTLLIDDNWQTLGQTKYDFENPFYRGWSDMEANTTVAPNGLKELITNIRTKHPYLKDIGVWHALMGYWGCLAPSGSIAKQYPTIEIDALLMGNFPAQVTTISPESLHAFYNDFYSFLRNSGITFVKTDVQHMVSTYQDPQTRRDLIATYQSAWTCAHLAHFGGKVISCMSQTPQTLFHSLLQTHTPPVVHRNSDDFYPEVAASHPWHVWTNAHNALFTRHLNVILDWDMFQTDHEYSSYHAAARCVSGGPVLITDVPGQHDVGLIRQMTATGLGGGTVTLRTGAGATVDAFGLYTEDNVLRVGAGTGGDGKVLGLFNTAEKEVRGLIHVREFGLQEPLHREVLVRGHHTGEVFGPIVLGAGGSSTTTTTTKDPKAGGEAESEMSRLIHVRLPLRGWDILTAQPIRRVETASGKHLRVCILGLLGKMSGAAAITTSMISVETERVTIRVDLKALGKLGVWFDRADANSSIEAKVQGSRVDTAFLKLTTLPEIQSGSGSGDDVIGRGQAATDSTHAEDVLKMPHIWEVDVEGFWKQKAMWDESCREALVELVVG